MSPASPLRWALVGASTIADEHLVGAIRAAGGVPATVYSRTPERARSFAEAHEIGAATSELEEVLGDPSIDVVLVSSVNDLHEEQVVAAAGAGKHVLCEKPLSTDLAGARRMVRACDAAGVVLAVNHHMRQQTAFRAMRELIADGSCGEVTSVRVLHAAWLPDHLRTWRLQDADAGAGVVLDLTVHDVDTLRYLLQDDVAAATAVTRGISSTVVETQSAAILELGRGTIATLLDDFDVRGAQTRVEVHGTEASLVAVGAMASRGAGEVHRRTATGAEQIPLPPARDPYRAVVAALTATVADRTVPLDGASGEDGLASLTAALLVREAARRGERLTPAALEPSVAATTSPTTQDGSAG